MKKLNNKGFTLVEVLAVLVILVVIMTIAIPNISSSLERSKSKQNAAKKEMLESYAELYISDNGILDATIKLSDLVDYGYASNDDLVDADGDRIIGCIKCENSNCSFIDNEC